MFRLNRTLATLVFIGLVFTPVRANAPGYWDLPTFNIGVTGQRPVRGTVVKVVGPVIVRKVDVKTKATAEYYDSAGKKYEAESNEVTLRLPEVEAWLSFYEDGKFKYTVKLYSRKPE